jgi:predicted aldo/keto reductase-like oxidoreductase
MRLPVIDDDHSRIEENEATRMLHYAIDHGVNYVDTAYPYHGGTCEAFVGRALQGGYRERVKLATKMPTWLIEAPGDLNRYLNEQLERLGTDHIDCYLLHGLSEERWPKMRDLDVLRWAEGAIADGRIGYLGFSFHDRYEAFQEIVDAYDGWTLCQIQYNYMDEEYQAGAKGLKYAADKGLAVVVMEPIRGGRLAKSVPQPIQELWDTAPRKRTPADWALQWVWNQAEVSLVLSGMSAMEHVEQNVASAEGSGPGTLTEDELALIARVRDTYGELYPIPCTACDYCLPCPSGVNIPRIFETYNDAMVYQDLRRGRMAYNQFIPPEERADLCTECEQCIELCPQGIDVPQWLAKAHEVLYQEEPS